MNSGLKAPINLWFAIFFVLAMFYVVLLYIILLFSAISITLNVNFAQLDLPLQLLSVSAKKCANLCINSAIQQCNILLHWFSVKVSKSEAKMAELAHQSPNNAAVYSFSLSALFDSNILASQRPKLSFEALCCLRFYGIIIFWQVNRVATTTWHKHISWHKDKFTTCLSLPSLEKVSMHMAVA